MKEVNEPVTKEPTSSHDAKAARASWRKYVMDILVVPDL